MLSKAIDGYDKILTTNADSGTLKRIAQEHLDKINHISEQNLYLFPDGYPQLSLHVDESNEKQNLHEVNLLLMRK